MPQKLIRLTSTTGDGVFEELFNEDIVIPENSEIALQSLSLERRSRTFFLSSANNTIAFQAVGNGFIITPTNEGDIEPIGTYSNQNDKSLLNAIQDTLNRNSSMISTPESMNIAWSVDQNDSGNVEISATPSPFFPITATAGLEVNAYVNLAAGGILWTQNTPSVTGITFDELDLGAATYRQTGPGGSSPIWWIPKEGSTTDWKRYFTKPTDTTTPPSGEGAIDPSTYVITINKGAQTLTPASTPLPYVKSPPQTLSFVENDRSVTLGITNAEELTIGEYEVTKKGAFRATAGTATNALNECYMYGSAPIIKSTGSFRARLNRLLVTDGEDSMVMGIIKGASGLAKLNNATFTDADFEYAIKIRGQTDAFQYKIKGGSYTDSASTPKNFTEANPLDKNDVFEICLDDGDFLGIVNQNSAVGGTGTDSATQMPRAPFDASEDYYFVLCLLENKEKIVLDDISISLDPNLNLKNLQQPPRQIDTYLPTTYSGLTSLIQYYPGIAQENVTDFSNGRINFAKIVVGEFGVKQTSLANFLGFPRNILLPNATSGYEIRPSFEAPNLSLADRSQSYEIQQGFRFVAPQVYALSVQPQNLLVETQTFTLDSYDSYGLQNAQRTAASGGSRRNILATIPAESVEISGTANALLQFEPSTLNYIAIKNRGAITTRQLKFRLLSSVYEDVELENMAAMTILIRSY